MFFRFMKQPGAFFKGFFSGLRKWDKHSQFGLSWDPGDPEGECLLALFRDQLQQFLSAMEFAAPECV